MPLKRQHRDVGDGDIELNKHRHLLSSIFKGVSGVSKMEELVPMLEPIFRKWVREEVDQALQPFVSRSSDTDTSSPRSEPRNLWLQFDSKLPNTLFTGNKIVSESRSCVKIRLYDPHTQQTVRSGPLSSMKVVVVAVEGDFVAEEWSKREFDSKVVQSREGKKPLVSGEVIVWLKNGEGCMNELCFTDNSSWIRSGKFRLGVRVHSGYDGTGVREGVTNAFKVKDQRGESYKKLHPPHLSSEVWRLEKIAKGGAHHKQLSTLGITTVGEFLRSYAMDQNSLRTALSITNKKWETIIAHATTCVLDDKRHVYRAAGGVGTTALMFNSIYRVIGVAFDGHTFHSVDGLDTYQMRRVEDLKQRAYANLSHWEDCEDGQGEVETLQMNKHETRRDGSSFELGESSEMQGFNLTFSNSFGVNDYMEPQDFTVQDDLF